VAGKVKYPTVTPEGVNRILDAIGVRYPIAPEMGATLEDRKAALLLGLNAMQERCKNWDLQSKKAHSKHLPQKLEKIKRRADALAKELHVYDDDDGRVMMDNLLLTILSSEANLQAAVHAQKTTNRDVKIRKRTGAQKARRRSNPYLTLIPNPGRTSHTLDEKNIADWSGEAAVAVSVAGVLWLSRWAARDVGQDYYGDITFFGRELPGEVRLIARWLPRVYVDFFNRPFAMSKNRPGPGIRFVHAAYSEMMRPKKEIDAIAMVCFRYRKK
jgi:hypothetical protein